MCILIIDFSTFPPLSHTLCQVPYYFLTEGTLYTGEQIGLAYLRDPGYHIHMEIVRKLGLNQRIGKFSVRQFRTTSCS